MRIGYSVEGSTDRALLKGLHERWCPHARLVEGMFRGQTQESRRREIPKICMELSAKQVDLIVFLTDSNHDNPNAWQKVRRAELGLIPTAYAHLAVVGVCQRNVECWICSEPEWIARETGREADDFRLSDPKGVFESAMDVSCRDRKEKEIADLVKTAPVHRWLRNRSFEAFYDELRQRSKRLDCVIENLRESNV